LVSASAGDGVEYFRKPSRLRAPSGLKAEEKWLALRI